MESKLQRVVRRCWISSERGLDLIWRLISSHDRSSRLQVMPEFKNLNQDSGLTELNTFLATRSYVDGYKPSGADSSLLLQITAAVDAKKYPHVSRWLTQITSFSVAQRAAWGGASAAASASAAKPAAAAAKPAAAAAPKKKAADSDDDFGLSSDSEDDEAIQAIADAHNKARADKAAASGKAAKIDKSMLTIFVKPAEDTTNMHDLAKKIKETIQIDSLQWGDYKLEPVAYGIMKAKMVCTYEDLKVRSMLIQAYAARRESTLRFQRIRPLGLLGGMNKHDSALPIKTRRAAEVNHHACFRVFSFVRSLCLPIKCSPDDVIEAIEEIEEVQSVDMDSVNILA
jgi:elongation factor 1-beta